MKFFLDTANLDELRKGANWGVVDGVTTNPTLIAKEKVTTEEQIPRICEIVTIYKNYGFTTQILAASLRHPMHVIDAAKAGAHIGTMPFKVLDMLFNHPLTDNGLEQFLKDYSKVAHETPVFNR